MARPNRVPLRERDLQGFKYFERLQPLLERLHRIGTESDRAGNRLLFYDQYVSLILLYFFNPVITSLRALQQASGLDKVQRLLGVRRTSRGRSVSRLPAISTPNLSAPSSKNWPKRLCPCKPAARPKPCGD